MRKYSFFLALLPLAGCSFGQTIAGHAIDYNKTVAESDDAQTLLNIIRASANAPTHFTVIKSFQGRLKHTADSTFSLTVPFGGDAASNFPFQSQAQFGVESNPLFDVDNSAISQDFINALTNPVQLETVKIFWDQGWPKDLLFYLLVEKIEIASEDGLGGPTTFSQIQGKVGSDCRSVDSIVENDPGKPDHARCFASLVRYLVDDKGNPQQTRLKLVEEYSGAQIGPALKKDDVGNLEQLLKVREKDLHLIPLEDETYQLCEAQKTISLRLTEPDGSCRDDQIVVDLKSACTRSESDLRSTQLNADSGKAMIFQYVPDSGKSCQKKEDGGATYSAKLRSLQGMIYFVGEIVRAEGRNNIWIKPQAKGTALDGCQRSPRELGEGKIALFKSEKGEPKNAAVAVDYHGVNYWIPQNDPCTRSMQTLAFLNQIAGLYQSREEVPEPTTIQTIDR